MEEKTKIFCGKVRVKETQWGDKIKVSYSDSDLQTMANYRNVSGWVNLVIHQSKKGNWYSEIDTWQPKNKQPDYNPKPPQQEEPTQQQQAQPLPPQRREMERTDDMFSDGDMSEDIPF